MDRCRICLKRTTLNDMLPLFNSDQLPHKIETISSIKIINDDALPKSVCTRCALNINLCFRFRLLIINNNYKLHLKSESIFEDPGSDLDKEDICHEETFQADDKNQILSICLKSDVTEMAEPLKNKPKKFSSYKCTKCDFQTKDRKEINRHRVSAHNPSVICSVCGKTLLASNMRTHDLVHNSIPVNCKICGKVQKNVESLRGHMKFHSGQQKVCQICGKGYMHSSKFAIHMRRHSTPKERKHVCHVCPKSFKDKETLKKHIRSHTGERPYPCKYCKKGFSSAYVLKTHIRQHTNESPYACALCSMSFRQKVSLKTHIITKHS